MYKVVKRIFDFICALIGIIGTSPFWIIAIVGAKFEQRTAKAALEDVVLYGNNALVFQ